ncbi:acyltransferase [Vibrio cholerae]|uniref:acyltransferase family protein n=1 Tax=Vibrio cholerae TaxID=666 RepID=UPI000841A528|nr:acyltransferase [Vibrio cholerae]EJL6506882.1 acyltransferase [Vibrio cholerae]MBJ6911015.1 acyltransferase [Vibrio cholerae]TQQ32845.1 acyltransferase [Vibrio cholerae]HDG1727065.1 acyltransferase [Vibrio cholerae]HDI3182336.1 acyltransferase [Vibrio cholerae]
MSKQSGRFEVLDAFRGLCAIFVVVFHMHLVDSVTELEFFRASSIFVEFFFVLSGFVLVHGYAFKINLKFVPYITARFFRLYPLHLFMFIVIALLEFGKWLAYKHGGFIFNNLPFTGATSPNQVIPNLLLLQSWIPGANHLSYNFPSWSISVEFYMYIILFLTIIGFANVKGIIWGVISAIALFLITINSDAVESVILRGLSCFFSGSLTYLIYKRLSNLKIPYILGSVIEALLLFGVVLVVQSSIEHKSLIVTVLFCFVVLFFSYESGLFSYVMKKNIFQTCGKLSYSIYMIHSAFLFCLISFFMILQKVTHIEMAPMIDGIRYLTFGNGFLNTMVVVLILSAVIYTSSLTYKYIELNGQKLGKVIGNKAS